MRQAIRAGVRVHVPMLLDGGRLVEGSNSIAAYLDEAYPDQPPLQVDPAGRSEVLDVEGKCGW